jgi:hypothetical protein
MNRAHPRLLTRSAALGLAAAALLAAPVPAQAKRLKVAEITSNSVLQDAEKGITYGPELMTDGKVATMWVEGEGSAGLGKYIGVKFEGTVELAKVRIWGGCFADADFWKRHNRVAVLELKYPDFTSEQFEIKDEMTPQWLVLKSAKQLDNLKIYLRRVYNGSTWNDTAVTELEFFDAQGPEGDVDGLKATASSEMADPDHAYAAGFAVDGWLDTYWVEGGGSGEGEWLDVDLGGSKSIKRVGIAVGFGETESFYKSRNRARKVTLAFSDGSSRSFELQDVPDLQVFELPAPVSASRVKLTFSDIIKGSDHDELYVGDVRFWQ